MRALLDSHTALCVVSDPKRLPIRTREIIEDDTSELFVSHASLWELAIKIAKGKLILPGNSVVSLMQQLDRTGILLLPIQTSHIARTETLPHIHKDPFDRMIVAQAIEENLTILSSDSEIPLYPVPVIWS